MLDKKLALRAISILSSTSATILACNLAGQLAITYRLGANTEADAVFAAISIPVAISAITSGLLANIFIPLLSRAEHSNLRERPSAESIFSILFILSIFYCLATFFLSSEIITLLFPRISGHQLLSSREALLIASISVPVQIASIFLSSIQSSRKNFSLVALSNVVGSVVTLLTILLWFDTDRVVPVSILIGATGQLLTLAFVSRPSLGHTFLDFFPDRSAISFFLSTIPLILSIALAKSNVVIERVVAGSLQVGMVSSLAYSNKLLMIAVTICTYPLATVFYPHLVDTLNDKSSANLNSLIRDALKISIMVIVPFVITILYFGQNSFSFILTRGHFSPQSTLLTYKAFLGYLGAFCAMTLGGIASSVLYAKFMYKEIAFVGVAGFITNVLTIAPLSESFGALGIALSFSLSASMNLALFTHILMRRKIVNIKFRLRDLARLAFLVTAIAIPSELMRLAAEQFLSHENYWSIIEAVAANIIYILLVAMMMRSRLPTLGGNKTRGTAQ